MTQPCSLRGSEQPLCTAYDAALLDLDGVVYIGDQAVKHAAQSIEAARVQGMRVAFVTNNASRTPETVAQRLCDLGISANPEDVITSSMAVARLLTERLATGSRILVVGGDGLRMAVQQSDFVVVSTADDDPAAVVQGYTPQTSWGDLAEATVAVNRGALWIAANVDATMPSPRGPVPGNGALVSAVAMATGQHPIVAGKPETPLHAEAVRRTRARRPLVVGDRLDTDIAGADKAGADSLLVLTGVTDARRLLVAGSQERPTYISQDLGGLLTTHPEVVLSEQGATCRAWNAHVAAGALHVSATGAEGEDLDALRALATLTWGGAEWGEVQGDPELLARLGLGDSVR
ncbi:MAG: glycerol-phosphatase [Frankiales bacterium]|nr:glycerol-phosphatase [Frankiales bacterium]